MNENDKTQLAIIEMWVLFQRTIEILDDLNVKKNPLKNQRLNSHLKALYPMIDKEVKNYDSIYKATPNGTEVFYLTLCENVEAVMKLNIIDKNFIAQCLAAKEKNPKSVEGILSKILKS